MSRNDRKPDPTRDQILNRKKQIQRGWSAGTKKRRAVQKNVGPITTPMYKLVKPNNRTDGLEFRQIEP